MKSNPTNFGNCSGTARSRRFFFVFLSSTYDETLQNEYLSAVFPLLDMETSISPLAGKRGGGPGVFSQQLTHKLSLSVFHHLPKKKNFFLSASTIHLFPEEPRTINRRKGLSPPVFSRYDYPECSSIIHPCFSHGSNNRLGFSRTSSAPILRHRRLPQFPRFQLVLGGLRRHGLIIKIMGAKREPPWKISYYLDRALLLQKPSKQVLRRTKLLLIARTQRPRMRWRFWLRVQAME